MKLQSIAALVLILAASPIAMAGTITFTAPTVYFTESNSVQTGYFDVTVSETGGSDLLNEFQVDVLLPSNPGITFIGADILTTSNNPVNAAPYAYAGNTTSPTPYLASYEAANSDVPNTNDVALSSTPLAMIRIEYSIAADFVGIVPITLNQDNPNTDPNADEIELGTDYIDIYTPNVTVNGLFTSYVPEPASWTLAVLGAIGLLGFRRLRRR